MSMNSSKGVLLLRRNAVSNALGILLPAVVWVLILPLVLSLLGSQKYGVFTIAIAVAGFLGFLELGLPSAATKFIAEISLPSDANRLNKILSTNFALYIALGTLVTLLGLMYETKIALLLFSDSGMPLEDLTLIVRLIGITVVLTLLRNGFSAILFGFQRYDVYNMIQMSYAVTLAAVQGFVVWLGGEVISLLVAGAVIMGASLIALAFSILRLAPSVRLLFVLDGHLLRILLSFGMYMMLINFAGIILFSMDKIIVGWILGPISVTYYAVPSQIVLKIHTAFALLVSFLFPLSSEVDSLGDRTTLQSLFLDSMQVIIALDGFILVFIGTFAREILTVWIGAAFAESASYVLVFTCFGYFMLGLSIVPYHFLLGMNRPKQFAILNLLATICVIGLFSVGLLSFGLLGGVILGMTSMLAMGILPWYAQRVLGISWNAIWNQSYGRAFALAVGAFLISIMLPPYWLVRACFFCCYVVLLVLVGNRRRHREMISEFAVWLFRSMLHRLGVQKNQCALLKEK